MPIQSFKHKGLQELFEYGRSRWIASRHHGNLQEVLDLLDNIKAPGDCVGIKDFHLLKGDRKGSYSMHISKNYCITFRWDELRKDVCDVNFEDYH